MGEEVPGGLGLGVAEDQPVGLIDASEEDLQGLRRGMGVWMEGELSVCIFNHICVRIVLSYNIRCNLN